VRIALQILFTGLCACAAASATAAPLSRSQALAELKDIKAQNSLRLKVSEVHLNQLLSPSPDAALALVAHDSQIEALNEQRRELILRQELIDRLIFQVDTKFKTGDLREFLSQRLVEMAKADLLEARGDQSLWKQLSYLGQALRELPERGENIVGFIDGYLKNSSFKKPLRPEEYLQARQYTNGREHVAAAPAPKDKVGEMVESRLNEIEAANAPEKTPAAAPAN
jgi:hypothetical protein